MSSRAQLIKVSHPRAKNNPSQWGSGFNQPRFSVLSVEPEAEVLELASHPEAVGHRLLLRVHVQVVVVEGGRLVDVHPRTKVEEEAGVVAEEFRTQGPGKQKKLPFSWAIHVYKNHWWTNEQHWIPGINFNFMLFFLSAVSHHFLPLEEKDTTSDYRNNWVQGCPT